MAKFRLNTDTIFEFTTFDTVPVTYDVPCPTGITFDETMDTYISDCAANAVKQHVLGAVNITGSFSGEVENDEDLTLVEPGTEVELLLQPTGLVVGNLQITADLLKITGRSVAMSSTGLTTYTCNFVMHDIDILAIPAP
jgi:hypothetical protein